MPGTLGPDVARAAVALHRSHPAAPVLEVLDVCMRQRTGRLADLGDVGPVSPFGQLLANPALVRAMLIVWRERVLVAFAGRYGLAI